VASSFSPLASVVVAIFGEISPFWGNFVSKQGNFKPLGKFSICGNFRQANYFDYLCTEQKKLARKFFFEIF